MVLNKLSNDQYIQNSEFKQKQTHGTQNQTTLEVRWSRCEGIAVFAMFFENGCPAYI